MRNLPDLISTREPFTSDFPFSSFEVGERESSTGGWQGVAGGQLAAAGVRQGSETLHISRPLDKEFYRAFNEQFHNSLWNKRDFNLSNCC